MSEGFLTAWSPLLRSDASRAKSHDASSHFHWQRQVRDTWLLANCFSQSLTPAAFAKLNCSGAVAARFPVATRKFALLSKSPVSDQWGSSSLDVRGCRRGAFYFFDVFRWLGTLDETRNGDATGDLYESPRNSLLRSFNGIFPT